MRTKIIACRTVIGEMQRVLPSGLGILGWVQPKSNQRVVFQWGKTWQKRRVAVTRNRAKQHEIIAAIVGPERLDG